MSIRDEVQAATAAHRDLGPGYDTAIAEGLVERIGEEIDRRVDARLLGQYPAAGSGSRLRPRSRPEPLPGRVGFGAVMMAICSMALALGGTAIVLHPGYGYSVSGGQAWLVALIWTVIGAINVSYARRP
jgi:hypothetical protein